MKEIESNNQTGINWQDISGSFSRLIGILINKMITNQNEDKGISPNITENVRRLILKNPPDFYNEKEIIATAKAEKYLNKDERL
jgi:hypothetical protein